MLSLGNLVGVRRNYKHIVQGRSCHIILSWFVADSHPRWVVIDVDISPSAADQTNSHLHWDFSNLNQDPSRARVSNLIMTRQLPPKSNCSPKLSYRPGSLRPFPTRLTHGQPISRLYNLRWWITGRSTSGRPKCYPYSDTVRVQTSQRACRGNWTFPQLRLQQRAAGAHHRQKGQTLNRQSTVQWRSSSDPSVPLKNCLSQSETGCLIRLVVSLEVYLLRLWLFPHNCLQVVVMAKLRPSRLLQSSLLIMVIVGALYVTGTTPCFKSLFAGVN